MRGYYKVDTLIKGGIVEVVLFNPTTKDIRYIIVDDMDLQTNIYDSLENNNLRVEKINKHFNYEYRKYRKSLNQIQENDIVKVNRGTKSVGFIGQVIEKYESYKTLYVKIKSKQGNILCVQQRHVDIIGSYEDTENYCNKIKKVTAKNLDKSFNNERVNNTNVITNVDLDFFGVESIEELKNIINNAK